jgi:hypothetical protein
LLQQAELRISTIEEQYAVDAHNEIEMRWDDE